MTELLQIFIGDKMSEVLVSIICNTYNHGAYIRQCLEGFVAQKTEYPFEILVHDDASTDNTQEIIREYENKYPKLIFPIYQTENQYSKGITAITQSIQFPRAKGKYVAICEGDDYWCDSRKIQKMISFLESHPEYSAAVHNVLTVDRNDNVIAFDSFGDSEYDIQVDGTLKFPQTSSYVMKNPLKDLSAEGKVMALNMISADKSWVLYMIKAGKIRFFPEYMSHYRLITDSGDSHSARKRRTNMTEHWIKNELGLYRQVQAYDIDLDISYHNFRNMYMYPLMFLLRHPNRDNLRLFIKARKCFPYSEWKTIKLAISYFLDKTVLNKK